MTLGDRIVVMKDGYIQQIGTPQEVFDHPRNLFVAGFIGTPVMNTFDAKLIKSASKYSIEVGGHSVELSAEKSKRLVDNNVDSQDIVLGVRPNHIQISNNGINAKVDVSELMGTSSHLHMTVLGKDCVAIVPSDGKDIDYMGKDVKLTFSGNVAHVFVKDGRNLEY